MMASGMQLRSQTDPRLYNPSRDCAHNFDDVLMRVATHLERQEWDDLVHYLKLVRDKSSDDSVTPEQIGEANSALVKYALLAHRHKPHEMQHALDEVGWFDVPWQARFACLACLGLVTICVYQTGIWEASAMGPAGPQLTEQELVERAYRASRVLSMPRWRWRIWRFIDRNRERLSRWLRR